MKAFEKVVTTAVSQPLPASSCVNASDGCVSPVTVGNIREGLFNLLSDDPDFPNIIGAIALAASGDGSVFSAYAGDPLPNVQPVWAMPLVCNDYGK